MDIIVHGPCFLLALKRVVKGQGPDLEHVPILLPNTVERIVLELVLLKKLCLVRL